jgi:hypothetical protein
MQNADVLELCLRCQGTGIDPVQSAKPRLATVDGNLVAAEAHADRCRMCEGDGRIAAQRR